MELPRWLILFFSETFTGSQVDIINQNWHRYSQVSLSNSTREELLAEARTILSMNKFDK